MAYRYAREKYSQAVHDLAVGEGDVRSRLAVAYARILVVAPDQVPEELRPDIEWICEQYSKRRKGNERLRRTLMRMRNSTGRKIAERILYVEDILIAYNL